MTGNTKQLTERLLKALGDEVVSIVLYGSAASGEHHAKFSDVNVLCVLRQVTMLQLRASESIFRWWREQGNPAPLLMTEHELRTSTDCFAMEFHDMKRHRQVLHGPDLLADLEIGDGFYRAQVERELRAKLLRLRQKSVGVLFDKDVLRNLLCDSISTFCVLFRHVLVLHGVTEPDRKRETIELAGQHFAIDTAPFLMLLDLREEKLKPKDVDPGKLLEEYMREIGKVIDAVDMLESERGNS